MYNYIRYFAWIYTGFRANKMESNYISTWVIVFPNHEIRTSLDDKLLCIPFLSQNIFNKHPVRSNSTKIETLIRLRWPWLQPRFFVGCSVRYTWCIYKLRKLLRLQKCDVDIYIIYMYMYMIYPDNCALQNFDYKARHVIFESVSIISNTRFVLSNPDNFLENEHSLVYNLLYFVSNLTEMISQSSNRTGMI